MAEKQISVIVCVYNREDTLPQCLEALAAQSLSPGLFEVVIVDNASTDRSPEIAASYAARFPHIRVCREPRQGLAAARNRGMREALAPVAAFTDDDAIPAADWAERLLARFAELGADTVAVGGELDPVWTAPRPDWLTGEFLLHPLSVCLGWSEHARHLSGGEWLCEANSAYRIAPVLERGGFPETLGRIGSNLLSGENAVNQVLIRDGFRFFFDPDIRVGHQIPAQRMTRDWFRRRFFWQGVTTFVVRQYLQQQGCDVEAVSVVPVPMNESSWEQLFGGAVEDEAAFRDSLGQLYGLGYLLAGAGLLAGR
ncbi:MAG: glycosyltransferase [Rhodobacteraceae bacterium]|nr:glycosyltransferase [Paracoccaceae bacterium]